MKAIESCFTVGFRLASYNTTIRRLFASEVKKSKPKISLMDQIKPNERSGVLSVVDKNEDGFPSYIILKETSPILRFVVSEI